MRVKTKKAAPDLESTALGGFEVKEGSPLPVRRSRTGPGLAGLVAAASTLFDAGSPA
jgi:hypothetical protein